MGTNKHLSNGEAGFRPLVLSSFHNDNGEAWIQDVPCSNLDISLRRCRECAEACAAQLEAPLFGVVCRFQAFRRFVTPRNPVNDLYSVKEEEYPAADKKYPCALMQYAGFAHPLDGKIDDISLWLPDSNPVTSIDPSVAYYIIEHIANRFCLLTRQEREATSWTDAIAEITWKRPLHRVREMCDVCSTTVFNVHWTCSVCGYCVCIDCYYQVAAPAHHNGQYDVRVADNKARSNAAALAQGAAGRRWKNCTTSKMPHEPDRMKVTHMIPSDAFWLLGKKLHRECRQLQRSVHVSCAYETSVALLNYTDSVKLKNNDLQSGHDDLKPSVTSSQRECDRTCNECSDCRRQRSEMQQTGVDLVTDMHQRNDVLGIYEDKNILNETKFISANHHVSIHRLFRDLTPKLDYAKAKRSLNLAQSAVTSSGSLPLDFIPYASSHAASVSRYLRFFSSCTDTANNEYQRYSNKDANNTNNVSNFNVTVSEIFPDTPHQWLDDGRLLLLTDPRCVNNLSLFRRQWCSGSPVLVSNCHRSLDASIWTPTSFSNEFGHLRNDLVDCANKGAVIVGRTMKEFWAGFECMRDRMIDRQGNPMILKLKDWPPKADFSDIMPSRFADLLQALPLPEYTHRDGPYNLASYLPDYFLRPDLGPKMYNAYGSALHPLIGSTNLHLDISDAINLILYVGVPIDDRERHEAGALKSMKQAGCCEVTLQRIRDGAKPGALWHIYDAKDAQMIRDLLNKVAFENGEQIEKNTDPIHDQNSYLDENLRERLLREYGVKGYTIVQCLGDAIFIPAGAPHQVRNLHSCIKAAEDFVSPENLSICFNLTQEFRRLADSHSNHEDKLQVKNIIYHAVKDAVGVLENGRKMPDEILRA